MQRQNPGNLRKKAAALAALLLAGAITVGSTLAYHDYKQHKSNEFSGSQRKYEARLVEDFEEVFDWKVGEDVKKEIRVANVGKAQAGYGDVYVRLQLKEFMQIGEMVFAETPERYMVARGGQAYTAASGKTYTFQDGYYVVFDSQGDAKSIFPNNNVKFLEDKVTGDKGWFIETKKGDFNGQYGKHVVTAYDFGPMAPVIPGSVFCPEDQRNHHGVKDPVTGEYNIHSLECEYPVHTWNDPDGPEYRAYIKEYIKWILGGDVIFMDAWDGKPAAKWILDDKDPNGWVYWGQALAPETATSNLLEKVSLINQPDGNFYYVIHTDMQSVSIDEFLKENGEGKDWAAKPKDSYVNHRPSITWNGTPPATVKAGESVQSPTVTVGPDGAAQGPLTWTSSNPGIATVDQNGKVTGVAEGQAAIIVTAPNGARNQYTITVTGGASVAVPVTGVMLNKNTLALSTGGSETLVATVVPVNAANKAVAWSSSDGAVATVDASGKVTAVAPGTAAITVTTADGSFTKTCAVTVTAAPLPEIPVQDGEGPYQMVGDDDDEKSHSLSATIDKNDFDNADIDRPGTIKLRDILAPGVGHSGITVTADPASLNTKVAIGKDKDGDAAIIIRYYGTSEQWAHAMTLPGNPYPQVQMTLILHKAGYADTAIKVNVAFEGTFYG